MPRQRVWQLQTDDVLLLRPVICFVIARTQWCMERMSKHSDSYETICRNQHPQYRRYTCTAAQMLLIGQRVISIHPRYTFIKRCMHSQARAPDSAPAAGGVRVCGRARRVKSGWDGAGGGGGGHVVTLGCGSSSGNTLYRSGTFATAPAAHAAALLRTHNVVVCTAERRQRIRAVDLNEPSPEGAGAILADMTNGADID